LCLFGNADNNRIITKTVRPGLSDLIKDIAMSKQRSTRSAQEREKLLEALRQNPITSHYARTALDIYHPNARIKELREEGHPIFTHWEKIDTGKGKHRVGKWVLLHGGSGE